MNSLNYCGTVFSNIIKASQAVKSSAELVVDLESQIAQLFNAAKQEVDELESQTQMDKNRIAKLEAEVESLKSKIPTSIEPEVV